MPVTVRFVKLDPGVPTPALAHRGDAGYDLTSAEDLVLEAGARAVVPTGLAVSIPEGYAGFVQPRSGLAARHGISIVNTPGLIDSHYRGEVKVVLVNLDPASPFHISRGDKICQIVFQKVEEVLFEQVENLDETGRGEGGFGSTGV